MFRAYSSRFKVWSQHRGAILLIEALQKGVPFFGNPQMPVKTLWGIRPRGNFSAERGSAPGVQRFLKHGLVVACPTLNPKP